MSSPGRILTAAALACAVTSCGETVEYTSAFLVTVKSTAAVDCILLRAENPESGQKVEQQQPAAEWRSGFREQSLKVLVYAGGVLDGPKVIFSAVGRRGSCDGQDVARGATEELTFEQKVVPVLVVLVGLNTDADSDGWPVAEDCDDARTDTFPGARELCAGRDNDCDDTVEDGCVCTAARACWPRTYDPSKKGIGACVAGTQRCNTSGYYDGCTDAVYPGSEICNGADDDCDASTDETVTCSGVGQVCRLGVCVPEREPICDGGTDEDRDGLVDCLDILDCAGKSCGAGAGSCCGGGCVQEVACRNGADDDCDGATDCADPACDLELCDFASRMCESLTCACPSGDGATELCNAVDEDCDGATDDGWSLGASCSRGLGICSRTGVLECKAQFFADCSVVPSPGDAVSENCFNALDDDCDGSTDCADLDCDLKACPSDASTCTLDFCSGGLCTHPARPNGTVCPDDGSDCTADACSDGLCQHPKLPTGTICASDSNDCTEDACSDGACVHPAENNGLVCADDGNLCTFDACSDAVCRHPARPNGDGCTDDGNACSSDSCQAGVCSHPARTGACCAPGQACNSSAACATSVSAVRDICDNTDNNCDGSTDIAPTCGGPTATDLVETSITDLWIPFETDGDTEKGCQTFPVGDTVITVRTAVGEVVAGSNALRVRYGPDQSLYFGALFPKTKDGGWDLSTRTGMKFSVRSNTPTTYTGWEFNGPIIFLCSSGGGSRRLTPTSQHLTEDPPGTNDGYVGELTVPFAGGGGWTVFDAGGFNVRDVLYIEFHQDPLKGPAGTGDVDVFLDGVKLY